MSDESDDAATDDADIEEQIATLAQLISQARDLVKSGHTIDLAGLSGKISDFCTGIAANRPDDAESVARMIEALVGDLNQLAEELAEQHAQAAAGPSNKGNGG
jgi:hypothetical protein